MSNINKKRKHSDDDEKIRENSLSLKKQLVETPTPTTIQNSNEDVNNQEPQCPIDLCYIPPTSRISVHSGGVSHVYNASNLLKHIEDDPTVRDPLTRIKYTPEQLQSVRVAAKALGAKVQPWLVVKTKQHIEHLFSELKQIVSYNRNNTFAAKIDQAIKNTTDQLDAVVQDLYVDVGNERHQSDNICREACATVFLLAQITSEQLWHDFHMDQMERDQQALESFGLRGVANASQNRGSHLRQRHHHSRWTTPGRWVRVGSDHAFRPLPTTSSASASSSGFLTQAQTRTTDSSRQHHQHLRPNAVFVRAVSSNNHSSTNAAVVSIVRLLEGMVQLTTSLHDAQRHTAQPQQTHAPNPRQRLSMEDLTNTNDQQPPPRSNNVLRSPQTSSLTVPTPRSTTTTTRHSSSNPEPTPSSSSSSSSTSSNPNALPFHEWMNRYNAWHGLDDDKHDPDYVPGDDDDKSCETSDSSDSDSDGGQGDTNPLQLLSDKTETTEEIKSEGIPVESQACDSQPVCDATITIPSSGAASAPSSSSKENFL